jgi:hypothetical protein
MYKSKFTFSDDNEQYEGYTDGSLWNGWSNVFFTREQLKTLFADLPYDYRFCEANTNLNDKDYPILIVYFEDKEIIESSPFYSDEVDTLLEGYCFWGFEFMEVK